MNIHFSTSRVSSAKALLPVLLVSLLISVFAQTSEAKVHRKAKDAPPANLEKNFLRNILSDQRAIWTSPFHMHGGDAKWLAPLGLATVALVTTDRRTSGELVEHGDNLQRLRISRDISRTGSMYSTAAAAGALYLTGRVTHNDRLRETGLLAAEALIDGEIVVSALKTASQRQRPPVDNSSGEFFDGGRSFPSGHAVSAWSFATIVAQEYGHRRPLVQVAAYGFATAVSLSRYTGREHFLSDVLVGSALGYGIGRYVYRRHHDTALDPHNGKEDDYATRSKLFPSIVPLYNARAHAYGGKLTWNF